MKTKNLICVFAHPDDEFISSGLLVRAKKFGYKTYLVCGTKGEMGRIKGQSFIGDASEDLNSIRDREIRKSCELLKIDKLSFLDLDDNNARYWNIGDAVSRLEFILLDIGPSIIVTFNRYGGNNHPDHIGIHDICVKTYEKLNKLDYILYFTTLFPKEYSVKNNLLDLPSQVLNKITIEDREVSRIIELSEDEHLNKLKVVENYKSQFPDENGLYYKMPYQILQKISKIECYEAYNKDNNEHIEVVDML